MTDKRTKWIAHYCNNVNTGTIDRQRIQSDDADDDDTNTDEATKPSADEVTQDRRRKRPETEEDQPDGELGNRWSSSSKKSGFEDLKLSDIILDPDGVFIYYWMGVVTMAIVYNVTVIVLRVAFKEMRDQATEKSVFSLLDTIGDVLFLVDIVVNFRISFYEDGCLVLNPDQIRNQYINSRKFMIDVISVLPVGYLYSFISVSCNFLFFDMDSFIPGKLHILLVRASRLLKYRTMVRFFDLTDSRTRNPNLVRTFKLSLNLWVVIHWIGCFYYLVSEFEGLGTNHWVYPNGTEYGVFSRKYIRVTYWSLMTLTTIGERPPPETDLEFVFTGVTFLVGMFVFAAVVGNVGDVISNMNATRTEFQSRMDQIKSYMQHRNVDEKLQSRVKKWADYTWNRAQSIDEPSLLHMLPDRLRTEIAINVHLETLKKVKIFEECEEGLLRELVLKLRPQVYSPGDYICRTGEVGKEMFIVNHGKVEILVSNHVVGKRTYLTTLSPGSYFGEISLLKIDEGHNRRTADVRAVGYSELLRLSRRDLMSALTEYPNAKRILEEIAYKRYKKTKDMHPGSIDEPSVPDTITDSIGTFGRSSRKFLDVIQSENFKRLIAGRQDDMRELKSVLDEVKQFDSVATKERTAALQKQNESLINEIKFRDTVILKLRNKIARLKSKDLLFRLRNEELPKRSQTFGHRHPNEQQTNGQFINHNNSESCQNCSAETSEHRPQSIRHHAWRTFNLKRNSETEFPRNILSEKCQTLKHVCSSEPNTSREPVYFERPSSPKQKQGHEAYPHYTSLSMTNLPFQNRAPAIERHNGSTHERTASTSNRSELYQNRPGLVRDKDVMSDQDERELCVKRK
ncbi:cyclic nucleotide-gated channel rod photoreceptor subunit alpha-like [Mya arenaria]|uniref:cyclic nucleotide-gated channel rod photoreceptor subunit alpha-like n=1 Tax=Mya arenaria TaxID=6604 RepID=UPI0022E2D60A|nr:cyclic nucleotide-gated channel rod photoreceptor subunit alpha-like [Mya arenaria]